MSARAPSPTGGTWLGHVLRFRRDPLGFLSATAETCGPIARLNLGPLVYHLVSDPVLIAEVLQERAANYVRDGRSARQMRLVTGEALLSTSGETWRRHRRLAQPMFHHHRIAALARVTTVACQETVRRWDDAARDGAPLDLVAELGRLMFAIVGRSLFSTELGPRSERMEQAYPVLVDTLFARARALVSLPLWIPTAGHRRFQHALSAVDGLVDEIIAVRRAAPARDDLLDLLLAARDEDGAPLSPTEIRNHAITFLLTGHETTASTLAWAFCLLDRHAGARTDIEHELDSVIGRADPALELLPSLLRLNAALHETLRLFPAIWLCERRVQEPDTLGGCAIAAGSHVVLSAYVTQRLHRLWPEADMFRPERFLTSTPPGLAQGFFPFGAGPHQCIGQHFALLQARLVLAVLLARFRVELAGDSPTPLAGITLRPNGRVPVRIVRR